jgi:hypothetical protein
MADPMTYGELRAIEDRFNHGTVTTHDIRRLIAEARARHLVDPPPWAAIVRNSSSAELGDAVRVLTEYGLSARETAVRLGVDARTVHRHRAQHRAQGLPRTSQGV